MPRTCAAPFLLQRHRRDRLERLVEIAEAERLTASEETNAAYTLTGLPFSGTTTAVACPFISATNLSAFGSMIGNEP